MNKWPLKNLISNRSEAEGLEKQKNEPIKYNFQTSQWIN